MLPKESPLEGSNPRLAAIALLLIVPAPTIGAALAFWLAEGTTLGKVAYGVGKAWLYLFPVAWQLFVLRKPLSLSPARHGGFGVAALLGLAISAAVWLVFLLYAESRLDTVMLREVTTANGLDTLPRYLLACAWLSLVNSALEEYVFRWFIFRQCEQLWSPVLAVVMAAVFFTIHHVIVLKSFFDWDIAIIGSVGVFLGGLIWSWCYQRYRSIWPGYVSHLIVDVAIFAVGWRLLFAS